MAKRKHTTEQIIRKLREAEVEQSKGQSIKEVCKKLGITEQTYYRWRKEYGGLRMDQARRFKQLEKENTRLKKLLAEMVIDNAILKEAAEGNF
jgi:transposase-like protein